MRNLSVALLSICLSGCAAITDWKSTQIQQGMSEADVVAKIGKPNAISLSTCGTNSASGPWTCRQYSYSGGAGGHRLIVYFSQSAGATWTVNNWSAL
jgi:hypothetical protein